jgi:ribonuclease T
MEKKYIVIDVEASGPMPGKYSMLSIGAAVPFEPRKVFYREIKPISMDYDMNAMRVGCLGLHCLEGLKNIDELNPSHPSFDPKKALNILDINGITPRQAMKELNAFVRKTTVGYKPVLSAAPIVFDGMFYFYYTNTYLPDEPNPFGYSGEDVNSIYRGLKENTNAHINDMKLAETFGLKHTHNALDDAILEAKEFEEVLKLMKQK